MKAIPPKRKKRRVKEPLTDELLQELLCAPAPDKFVATRTIKRDLPTYLNQLLEEKGLKRADVIRASDLNSTYGWDIFKGERKPTREPVIALTFGLQCTLQEANRVLQAAGHSELYCKNRRDAIIIYCINNKLTLQQTNETLYAFKEETINYRSK